MPTAAWMATEFWGEFGPDIAVTLTPVGEGRLEVYLGGHKLLDRKEEDGRYPGLDRVRELKKLMREKIAAVPA
ncbi:MAG: Rdx family protein [Dehalococcoidia bacterium]